MRYSSTLFETNNNHIDSYNIKVVPTNDTPLLLPCKNQIGNPAGTGTNITCNFDNAYANTCWAAMDLKCPSMIGLNSDESQLQRIRVIQAQLNSIFSVDEDGQYYKSVSMLNMDNMNIESINENTNTGRAIKYFKEEIMELTGDLVNCDLTQTFLDELNQMAPIPQN